MTRLRSEWIEHMTSGMEAYNKKLVCRAGIDLSGLILTAYGKDEKELDTARRSLKVGVVPITQGRGVIASFSEAVAAIIKSVGFEAAVADYTDVDGIYHLKKAGADIIFMADDERYLALNTINGRTGENDYCTALGFICVLKSMAEMRKLDISKEKILVIGYGRVGKQAASILTSRAMSFDFFDKDIKKRKELAEDFGEASIGILESECEIKNYRCILDFTDEGGWLRREALMDGAIYSSPGVPISLNKEALLALQNDAVYDNLEIGTAMMLAETIFNIDK